MIKRLPEGPSGDAARRVLHEMRSDGFTPGDEPPGVDEAGWRYRLTGTDAFAVLGILTGYGYLRRKGSRYVIVALHDRQTCGALASLPCDGRIVAVQCAISGGEGHGQHEARGPRGRTVRWRPGEVPQ